MIRCGVRAAARTGSPAPGVAGLCLLAGLTGILAGCGGGALAPVQEPTEPVVPGRGREHVVGRGETLYSIAWRHGTDYRVLAGINSIRDPYTIHPGQRLLIPEPDEAVPPAPEPDAARSEPAAAGDVSTRGIGSPEALQITPLPPSSSKPSMEPPGKASAEAAQPRQALPGPVSKPASESSPEVRRETPAQRQRPVSAPASKRAAEPSLAARTVAGLSWTRPTGGRTIKGFGRGGNKGLDIAGAFEQPIRAAAPGQVVYAGSGLVGYGKLIIVKHDSRLLSAYAHNERLHVGEGDEVAGGQHIADMGRSARGRAMLHFEIRRDGKPVDPVRFLP